MADQSLKLPALAAGTFDYRGVQHVRTGHVIEWLEDVQDSLDRDMIAPGDLLGAIIGTLRLFKLEGRDV